MHRDFPCEQTGHVPIILDIYTGFSVVIHVNTERLRAYKLVHRLRVCSTDPGLPFAGIYQIIIQ